MSKYVRGMFIFLFALFMLGGVVRSIPASAIRTGAGSVINTSGAACDNYLHGFVHVCDSTNDGGASWHVYSTNQTQVNKLGYNSAVMKADKRNEILSTCAGSPWFAVYGWDGRKNGLGSGYVQYGPINYTSGIDYNEIRNPKKYSDLNDKNITNGMQLTEGSARDIYRNHSNGSELPSNNTVGYFCIDPEDITTYYALSNASTGEAGKYTTSKISSTPKSADILEVNLEVGQSTSLIFSHNIFTSREASGVYYQIQKKVYINNANPSTPGMWIGSPNKYEFSNVSEPSYYSGTNIDVKDRVTVDGKNYYAANTRPFTDGGERYLFRDVYGTVKFKVEGEYKFCEKIFVNDIEYTEACIKVNVGPKSSYLSKSNISNRATYEGGDDSDWQTTDIIDSATDVYTKDIKINKGGNSAVTFSHNIYSTSNKNADTVFRVRRTVNDSPGISGDFEVNTKVNPSDRSSQEVREYFNGDAKFTNDKTGNYYVASPRPYTDGENLFSLRDYYDMTFPEEGVYTFCERVEVWVNTGDGQGYWQQLSGACSRVIVGEVCVAGEPGCEVIVDSECPSDWTPQSYISSLSQSNSNAEATTSVIAATRNNSVSAQSNWVKSTERIVWAKPGDDVRWLHCYYPGVQAVYNFTSTKSNSHPHPPRLSGNTNTLNNIAISSWDTWENGFKVTQSNMTSSNTKPFSPYYSNGDSAIKSWKDSYTVESGSRSRAGLTLTETAIPTSPAHVSIRNDGSHSWKCNSYQVCETTTNEDGSSTTTCHTEYETCNHSNDYYPSSRSKTNSDNDTATVKVPYNYENTASVTIDTSKGDYVYAGETVTIEDFQINVNPTYNNLTNGSYATKVHNAQLHLIAYVSDSDASSETSAGRSGDCSDIRVSKDTCDVIASKTRDLNNPENTGGFVNHEFSKTGDSQVDNSDKMSSVYNVYDAPAGKNYCVVAAVYPARSHNANADGDSMDTDGNGRWYISAPHCVKVAKRPSFEVWGGSLYTSGEIIAEPSTKKVVAGFHDFSNAYSGAQATNSRNTTVFGSWVEQSILAPTTSISGIASGASTGYFGRITDRTDVELLGGSHEGNGVSYCIRSPLTIPNVNCGSNNIAGGFSSINVDKPGDKSALVSRFSVGSSNYSLHDNTSTIGYTEVAESSTEVYTSNGEINITGDIIYKMPAGGYKSVVEIPKVIIYAKDIKISCTVKQIDAVLIADNSVKTCNESEVGQDDSSSRNANQLKIFGTVISDKLVLNRSYGAAAGKYNNSEQLGQAGGTMGQARSYNITDGSAASVVPAEIIDYDTSLYLWGAPRADASASGKLDITYQTELSPRY